MVARAITAKIVLIATFTSATLGADGTWTNTAGGTWSTSGNWSGGVVANGIDSTADFSTLNIAGNPTVTLDSARTIGNLIFGDAVTPSNDWTLASNTLTLDLSSGSPTINVVNRTATINSLLAGTDGFTKTGAGSLVLTSTNPVSGLITFNGGTTTLNSTGKISASGTTYALNSGAKLVLDNTAATSASNDYFDRLGSGALMTLGGGEYSFLGSKFPSSFQTLALAFARGQSTISIDSYNPTPLTASALLFISGTASRTVGATALLRGDNLGNDTAANVVQIKASFGTAIPTGSLSNFGSGPIVGIVPWMIGDISPIGNGTDFVTYVNDGAGNSGVDGYKPLDASNYNTTLVTGNVKLSAAASTDTRSILALALTNSGTGTVATINAGHTLTIASDAIISAGSVANTISGGNLTFGANAATINEGIFHVVTGLTVNSAIVDSGPNAVKVIKSSDGTLLLTGANTYSGGTWINAGTLQVSSDGNLGGAAGAITMTGGTLNTTNSFATSRGITLNPGTNTFNINAGTTLTANGAIGGTGGLTMATGTGTLVLGASNSFSGGVTLNSGTLAVSADSNLGAAGGGVTMGGGTLNPIASFSMSRGIVLNSASSSFNVGSGATLTAQGTISGTAGLTKAGGTGTLALTGTNTYSGGTFLNAGTLSIGSNAALGAIPGSAATNVTFGGSATLQLTSGAGSVALSSTRNISIGNTFTGTFDSNGAGNTLTVGGVISGTTGNLAKTGAGTLAVGIANTYTGTTTISEGTLSAGDLTVAAGISSLGNATSAVSIGGASTNGTLLYTGANDTMTRGITLGAGGGTMNVSTGATTLIVSGKVSGGALGKNGPGTLTLSNATNDYTGATTVTAGTLKAGVVTNAFGNLSAVTVNSGATLDLATLSQTIGSLAGTGNVTFGTSGIFLTAGGNNTSTNFSGNLSGLGGLIKNGTGVLTLIGNNNQAGSTTVNGGTLRAGSTTGFTPTNTYSLAANTTLDLNNNNVSIDALTSSASTSAITLGSGTLSLTGASGSFLTFAGAISGTGGLNVGGIGKFTLSGTNSYSGATLVNTTGASTGFAANAANALSAASAHTVNGSATLFLNSFNNAVGSLAGNGTVTLGSGTLTAGGDNSSTTFSGAIGGTGGVTKVGTGTFVLSGTNGYSGATTINGGTLSIAGNGNIGSGSLAIGGGTLNTTASMVLSRATTLNAGTNSFNVNSGTTLEITGAMSGSGGLTVAGGGRLISTGAKLFSGGVTMNSGILQVAADDSLGTAGTALAFAGGTLNSTASFTSNRPIALNAGANTFDVNSATTLSEQGAIGGTGVFVKQGAGTLILSGANDYSGATNVEAGILRASNATALGSNSTVTVNGTLDLDSNNVSVGSLAGSGTVTLGSGVLTAGGNNATTSFSGAIGGSGALIKTGSGTLTLSGVNNYAGTTTISAGTLAVGAGQNLGAGDLRIGSGSTFASTGTFATNRLTELTGGQGTIEVVGSPTTLTLNTGIIGAGSLFKIGTGTLALAATSNYLGDTTIGAGTLSLITGGSIPSNLVTVTPTGTFDVTVAGYTVSTGKTLLNNGTVNGPLNLSGGTISGSGTFNGELTIGNSSVISPGNSPGTMGTAGQTWAGAGTYKWEIDQASRTLGVGKGVDSGYDWINMSGALSMSATSGNPFVIDITGLSHGSHSMGAVAGFDEARAYEWTIATASSGISSFDASKFTLDATNFTNNNSVGTGAFSITTAGNDVRLVFTPGPNESTLFFGPTPGSINGATSTTNASVAFGRVMQNSIQTSNVTLNRVGMSTDYTIAIAGDATSNTTSPTEFNKPTTSHNIDVALNTANTGARSGSLTIDNLASTSAADGQGSADGNDTVSITGTVLANRDIAQSGSAVNLGKAFVGLNTATGSATLSGGAQDDNNATRVDINAGNAAAGGVTVTYTSGADNRFDSASESKSLDVVGNFALSGSKSGSVNAASMLSNGETGAVGATLDTSAPVSYSAEIYQVASISSSAIGLNLSIANANTTDAGQRASAKIVSRSISQGDASSWSVTNFNVGTAIAQNTSENGVAAFDPTGKLNGTHRASFAVGLEHQDQTIVGAAPGDLGSRQFAIQQVVSGNVNGGTATVLAGQDYGNISTGFNSVESGNLQTAATLLHGTAAAQRNITMSFNVADHSLSDVLTLTGTGNDVFVLQLSYVDSPGQEADLFLGSRDSGGEWLNAVAANTGGTPFAAGNMSYADYIAGFGGSLTAANLGAYGRDEAANVAWAILNHNSEFAVAVPLQGDYNHNGTVDAADYVTWRKTDNTQPGYDTWRSNFGQPPGSGAGIIDNATVPEPPTMMLLMFAAAGWCLCRGRAA
jgi:autotransporter-associated beta strand protein